LAKKVWWMNRFSQKVVIVSRNLDSFSLVNQGWFTKFAKLSPCQTFPLYSNVASNAMKSLNFVRWKPNKYDESVKSATYLGLIGPKLEYASSVWDLYLAKDICIIERVQRIAAIWIKTYYKWESSVSCMLSELQWSTLLTHRLVSRFTILYKALLHVTQPGHFQHPKHFNIPIARTTYYYNSFFLKNIWEIGILYQLLPLRSLH